MKTIVIVGGGAAGLQVAIGLGRTLGKKRRARVVLVDRSPTHLWKPLLHEVAAGRVEPTVHHTSFALQAERNHFHFVQGELASLDRTGRVISVATGGTGDGTGATLQAIAYDKLVLAVGGVTQYFGVPGAREHALALDSVSSAEQVRERLHATLRRACARAAAAPQARPPQVRVAIVGAGATGVQLAAQLRRTTRVLNRYGVHRLDPVRDVDISVLEASPTILPGMDRELASRVARQLTKMNIRVATGQKVTSVTAGGLTLDGSNYVDADIVVWAAGVAAPPQIATFGLAVNEKGQARVGSTLQSLDDDNIFAIGDCASCRPTNGANELPTRAQVAYQQALYLQSALPRHMSGKAVEPFAYRDYGSLISLAGGRAVGSLAAARGISGWYVEGKLAALMHHAVYRRHILAINGWGRALVVSLSHGLERLLGAGTRLH
ncbi:NAD(P)/FAD-dependent oxidoreductase [Cupriavidus necator]|uniref:NAD(P)/FAD-dependent oxidoreductase n=1 Tax=Cupriavidus necator TaxID=106590 RepID=UPI0005B36F8B|nr:NAD(P)/FAD-dependent oxidoreductase [Cupriavidus necator]